jgi:hypothetical protein
MRGSEVVGFNAAMSAWAQGGPWQQVLHLLRRLRCHYGKGGGGRSAEHGADIMVYNLDMICIYIYMYIYIYAVSYVLVYIYMYVRIYIYKSIV